MRTGRYKKLLIPKWWFNKFVKYFFYLSGLSDLRDYFLIRRKHPQIPKTRFIWGGTKLNSFTFYKWSLGDLEIFKKCGNITPSSHVLDVGCGIGRLAFAFDTFLQDGKYLGFDTNFEAIKFNKNNYLSDKLNFLHVDVKNTFYYVNGKINPEEFIFPYDENSFDFVFLISVFTHMTNIDNYLKQISRVLKKDKRCLITFFLLNETNRNLIVKEKSWLTFKYKTNNSYVEDVNKKEFAVAYDESFVRSKFEENGLQIVDIEYGSWSGRGDFKSILKGKSSIAHNFTKLQDIVVAKKI